MSMLKELIAERCEYSGSMIDAVVKLAVVSSGDVCRMAVMRITLLINFSCIP
mgnify:CR=1 FL=1